MVIRIDTAHLLYGSNNQALVLIIAFQYTDKIFCVFRIKYIVIDIGKAPILVRRLGTKLNTVKQEYHLVCIISLGNQLCRFERCHCLSRTSGMPNETSFMLMIVPIGFTYPFPNLCGCEVLITTKHLQGFVLVIGNGIVTHHLMSHRN